MRTFSPARLQSLRDRARRPATLPADVSDGWVRSAADPMELLPLFKPLRLRHGYVLRAYQRVSGADARSVVFAMPADAPLADYPPPAEHAERKFTRYLEGDGSPKSYAMASILTRELLECGAVRHGCWWGLEKLIGETEALYWTWMEESPCPPTVRTDGGSVSVTFCTYTAAGPERITKYTDTYELGQYTFVTDGAVIAMRRVV